ncbi:hypothetical protein ID866_10044 [Astraeus odoratus]|nr:hypothetical protein ID866_10044 [Astraeus odoratus]
MASELLFKNVEEIGDKEQRMDICVAAAGIHQGDVDCLEYSADEFRKAAGRQIARFGSGGSIILVASIAGSISSQGHAWIPYHSSKAAVIQMARNMACELGPKKIRVNSISPGFLYTKCVRISSVIRNWCLSDARKRIG